MTKGEVVKAFRLVWCTAVASGEYSWRDQPAHNLMWGDHIDYLCRTGKITTRQYNNWLEPKMLVRVPKEFKEKI